MSQDDNRGSANAARRESIRLEIDALRAAGASQREIRRRERELFDIAQRQDAGE